MTGAASKTRGALEVIIFEDARFRGSQMFTSAEVTIGSDPGVMLRLDDPELSPCHAAFRFDGEDCAIENYDQVVGTLVNGVAVAEQTVSPTDEIQIGRFRLRINVHRPDTTPSPVSARPPSRPAPTAPRQTTAAPAKVVPLPVPPAPPMSPSGGRSLRARPTTATQTSTPAAPSHVRTSAPSVPARGASAGPTLPAPGGAARRPPAAAPAEAPASARSKLPPAPAGRVAGAGTSSATRPGSVAGTAPTALAVAPTIAVNPPKPVPAPAHTRPSLASVPAESQPRTARSATQPIASHYADVRTDSVPANEIFEVTTERTAAARSSGQMPVLGFDDDDDDDAFFEPSFSLLDRLRDTGLDVHKSSAVEVIRFRHGCVLKLHHLRRGEKLRLHGLRKPLGRSTQAGGFLFSRDALPDGVAISRRGRPLDDATWRQQADDKGRIPLEPATQVLFPLPSGEGVLVHLVPAAGELPKSTWRPRLSKLMLVLAGVSVLVHLIVFTILGVASLVRRDFIADKKEGRFARIALKEIELEPPAPPPKHERKKAKPERTQAASNEPSPRVATPHIPRARAASAPQAQSAATTQKLLSALGGLSAGPKPMSATAMSNLAAVGPVHGGGFKVSGAIGRLPGDSLRLAAAGSGIGRLDTKSANDVGKNLGRVLGRAPSGQVRAQVSARPKLMRVEGRLDRGEIQKVINAHIHELQGCFERQLIVNPNLAGKVTFEWIIGTSGAVTVVKIKASSLSSNEATSCMQAAIRRWQFPAPSGGQVTVIYPIALASSGA
jgi:predicted component of type VI protein secretion system